MEPKLEQTPGLMEPKLEQTPGLLEPKLEQTSELFDPKLELMDFWNPNYNPGLLESNYQNERNFRTSIITPHKQYWII